MESHLAFPKFNAAGSQAPACLFGELLESKPKRRRNQVPELATSFKRLQARKHAAACVFQSASALGRKAQPQATGTGSARMDCDGSDRAASPCDESELHPSRQAVCESLRLKPRECRPPQRDTAWTPHALSRCKQMQLGHTSQ